MEGWTGDGGVRGGVWLRRMPSNSSVNQQQKLSATDIICFSKPNFVITPLKGVLSISTSDDDFTVLVAVTPPWPWPPSAPLSSQHRIQNNALVLNIGKFNRIEARSYKGIICSHNCTSYSISCPIATERGALFHVLVRYSSGILDIFLNGKKITFPSLLPAFFVVKKRFDFNIQKTQFSITDFSIKNQRARRKRADRFQSIWKENSYGETERRYLFNSLRDEISQLKDLITLVKNGNSSHARGIMSRSRLLLNRKGQTPVLQMAAAAIELRVNIIYGCKSFVAISACYKTNIPFERYDGQFF